MQTALQPLASNGSLPFLNLDEDMPSYSYYYTLHQTLYSNQSRSYYFYVNGQALYNQLITLSSESSYLDDRFVYAAPVTDQPLPSNSSYALSYVPASGSSLPPVISAAEIFSPIPMTIKGTNLEEAQAMLNIKQQYDVMKNWMGDPCIPQEYAWEGLICGRDSTGDASITSIDLSFSNLRGTLSAELSKFSQLTSLDLSNNNLSGPIPDIFDAMTSLTSLNLTNNDFIGSIPEILLERNKSGTLTLRVDCVNPNGEFCSSSPLTIPRSPLPSHRYTVIGAACAAAVGLLLLAVIAVVLYNRLKRRKAHQYHQAAAPPKRDEEQDLHPGSNTKQYTFAEIRNMTNGLSEIIGKGGFGAVYRGYLENRMEVAVKVGSEKSSQGKRQFLAEAKSLSQVHHKNLVRLIGYCNDEGNLALVYEYMSQGSLQDHLQGNPETSFTWQTRLQVAVDAAQGLDYLHTGCTIIHRDVKSNNILLDGNMRAKVADFGLARLLGSGNSQKFTNYICGTPGYIDPEYNRTLELSYKSDVYSFGVVLLEILTGKKAIMRTDNGPNVHISDYVDERLATGSLEQFVDPGLQGEYDASSAWTVVELAKRCTVATGVERPTMAQVATELRECLTAEISRVQMSGRSTDLGPAAGEVSPHSKSGTVVFLSSYAPQTR